jgi:hypothetical protein
MSDTVSAFDREQLRVRPMGQSVWIISKAVGNLCVLAVVLAIGLWIAFSGWQDAMLPDIAVFRNAAARAARLESATWSFRQERSFYLVWIVAGLLVAFWVSTGFTEWWALHVTGKAPALQAARIKQLEEKNTELVRLINGTVDEIRAAHDSHTKAFDRLTSVLRFPGLRAVVLAALHPDRGRTDAERHTLTERFKLASSVFDELVEG